MGARPQFIKLAPLAKRLSTNFNHIIIHTGQHYDPTMSDIFFQQLDIQEADHNLGVGSGHHGEMTAKIMTRLEKLLLALKPDAVLVFGDTNSTIAGALTTAKMRIPLGHVEAGLRSYRMDMPEEINRRVTDHVSDLLFCPSVQAIKNLKSEGIRKGIVRSGDLMYELIERSGSRIESNKKILEKHCLAPGKYLLITMHRAGNVDDRRRLEKIVAILLKLKSPVIFPVHPRTRKNLRDYHLLRRLNEADSIILTEPLPYLDNLTLMCKARAVLTDSGGVQKEAVFLGTPCLTLRDETEWVETLNRGNYLVGLSAGKVLYRLNNLKATTKAVPYRVKGKVPSEIIVSSLSEFLKGK